MATTEKLLDFKSVWEYSSAPESTDHIKLKKQYELFINGEFVTPKSRKYILTENPATGKKIARVAEASKADVNIAVNAARTGYNKFW